MDEQKVVIKNAASSKTLGTALAFAALALLIATVIFWFYLANKVSIPANRTLFIFAFLLAPVLGVASFVMKARWFGSIAAVAAIIGGVLLTATIAISRQQVADNPITVGDTVPYFTAVDDQGDQFVSDVLYGTPTVIKFFRGHW